MTAQRIKKLQKTLKFPLLIKNPGDLFYLTGLTLADGGLLFITKKQAVLFGGYLEKVVIKTDSIKKIAKYIGQAKTVNIDEQANLLEFNYLNKLLPKVKFVSVPSPVKEMRVTKDSNELLEMKRAYGITVKVFAQVKKTLKQSRNACTEKELAHLIKMTGLNLGADDISFPVIVASGSNAAVPHHVPGNKTIKVGESVVMDFGFKVNGYCSDFARTIFLKKISPELAKMYSATEEAYKQACSVVGNNVVAKEVDLAARKTLAQYNLDEYFIHSVGHGTGLDVHEAPHLHEQSTEVLKNGMVFSIEPGVYIPRFGGIRIEDLVYLKNGKVNYFHKTSTALKDMII